MSHGRIRSGVVTTPDLEAALVDYRDRLGLTVVEEGRLGEVAASWDAANLADARVVTLQPTSGASCFIRLIEQELPVGYRPTTTFGWNAYEITVQDVFGWPDRLAGSGFEVVGAPKHVPGFDSFVAMQVVGRGQEMIYLNEVYRNTETSDLPRAASPIDHIFIVILGVPDRPVALDWYRTRLGLSAGGTYTLPYSMINNAFGLPAETLSTISMVQNDRLPIIEIDEYPVVATPRSRTSGGLPPGNALVTLEVDNLDGLNLEWITAPCPHSGLIYGGRRTAAIYGPAGELLELVER